MRAAEVETDKSEILRRRLASSVPPWRVIAAHFAYSAYHVLCRLVVPMVYSVAMLPHGTGCLSKEAQPEIITCAASCPRVPIRDDLWLPYNALVDGEAGGTNARSGSAPAITASPRHAPLERVDSGSSPVSGVGRESAAYPAVAIGGSVGSNNDYRSGRAAAACKRRDTLRFPALRLLFFRQSSEREEIFLIYTDFIGGQHPHAGRTRHG